MRRAARQDANHSAIVKALRDAGCTVRDTSAVGDGFPDLVVLTPTVMLGAFQRGPRLLLVEVKDGSKPPSARKLTPDQERFAVEFQGHWACVKSEAEAIELVTRTEA